MCMDMPFLSTIYSIKSKRRSEVHGRKLMRYYIRQFLNLFKDGKNILTNNFVIANKFYLFSQHSSKIKAPKN